MPNLDVKPQLVAKEKVLPRLETKINMEKKRLEENNILKEPYGRCMEDYTIVLNPAGWRLLQRKWNICPQTSDKIGMFVRR